MSALYNFWKGLQGRVLSALSTANNPRESISASQHFLRMEDMELFEVFLDRLLPDPDEVLKKAGLTAREYYQLMTDAHVAGSVMQRKSRVKRMNIVYQSGDIDDPKANAALELCERQLYRIERLPEVVNEILDAPLYGATYLELFWSRLPMSTESPNGEIVLQNIMAKPFQWFVYDVDGNLKAKTIDSTLFGTRDLPPNKFVACVKDGSYRNPYGERAFKRCFWSYQFKKGGLRFWTEFLEKYGMPFLYGKMNSKATDEDLTKFHNDLANMVRNGIVATRTEGGEEITTIEAGGKASSSDAYKAYKNAMNIEISKAILGETLTIENSETGSQAATETHLTVLESIQDEDKVMVERTLKKIARLLTNLNFGVDVPCPEIKLIDPKELSVNQASRDAILTEKLGVRFTKPYVARVYKLPDDEFEIKEPSFAAGGFGGGLPAGEGADADAYAGGRKDAGAAGRPAAAKGDGGAGRKPTAEQEKDGGAAGGATSFGEGGAESFTVQKSVDAFVDGSVDRMEYLTKPLAARIKEILKTSETYEEMTVRLATISGEIDSKTFARMFSDSLDIAYYIGENAVKDNQT